MIPGAGEPASDARGRARRVAIGPHIKRIHIAGKINFPIAGGNVDAGDRLGALYTALRIARLHPAYFLAFDFGRRLLLPQNRRRFRLLV